MKKAIIFLIILIISSTKTFAASPSPTAKPLPVSSSTAEKAKELKEKVASKIAELKVVQKKAFMGYIKSINDKGLILTSKNKDISVETNTDTKIIQLAKGKRTNIKLSDLSKDQKIIVWGQYNTDQESLTAKEILTRTFSQNLAGVVKSIDKDSITITDKSENKDYTLKIASAKIRSLKKGNTLGTIKSSDISEGDFVHVYASSDSALRILILPKSTDK